VIAAETIWREQRIAVVDTETTGLDVATSRVVEVGVVILDRGMIVDRRGWLVNPGAPIPPEASEIHGITDAMVEGAPSFDAISVELSAFVDGSIAAGFNARFDRAQLLAEFFRVGLFAPPFVQGGDRAAWIDILAWARAADPWAKGKGRHKLGAVASRLGVELGTAHRALGDCVTAARVLWKVQGGALDASFCGYSLARMPDRWSELQMHQRRLQAESDANHWNYIAGKQAEQSAAREVA